MHLATVPCGMRWTSWSRWAGRAGRQSIRAVSVGGRAATTARARDVRGRRRGRSRRRRGGRRGAPAPRGRAARRRASASAMRHALRAADEAVLLGAALGADQGVERAGRARCRRGRAAARGRRARPAQTASTAISSSVAAPARGGVAADPGVERLGVPLRGLRRLPRRRRVHAAGHPLQTRLRLPDVGEDRGADARDRAPVAHQPPVPVDEVLARGVRRVRVDSSSRASARMRSCVGPTHCPPISTTWSVPATGWFSSRPPTRSRASRMTTE